MIIILDGKVWSGALRRKINGYFRLRVILSKLLCVRFSGDFILDLNTYTYDCLINKQQTYIIYKWNNFFYTFTLATWIIFFLNNIVIVYFIIKSEAVWTYLSLPTTYFAADQ